MEPIFEEKQKLTLKKDIRYNDQKEVLSSLINNLYISLNPSCPKNYKLPKNIENFIVRIISTNFSIMKNGENIIINSLIEKVNNISRNNEDTENKFQNLYNKLIKKRTLGKRWGILYLLNHFSKNDFNKSLNFSVTNELQKNFLECYETLNNKIERNFPENIFDDYKIESNNFIISENKKRNLNCKEKCNYYLNNLFSISDINKKFCENESQINENKLNFISNLNIYPLVINPAKTSLTITEKDLINDLIYAFEGINGKYIAYDAREDAFILNKLIPWSEEIYDIVNTLSELGWLYKNIKNYINLFKTDKTADSQFTQSFIYAVQKELDNYFKLISFFKKMNNSKKKLNLKNLFLWTLEPKEKLKWIYTCCETTFNLKGAAIFSQIYSLKNYLGSNSYLNNILNEVSKPFLTFVLNWIKYGELEDPYKEFFVDIIDGISNDDIWNLKYQLIVKNVPNFMEREKTIKIFEVGKGIHFLRNYCQEKINLSNLKENLDNLINHHNNKYIMDKKESKDKNSEELDSLNECYNFINYLFDNSNIEKILDISLINLINKNIDIIHNLMNETVIEVIFNKFKFSSNLESINKYLLLGQGDMMQTLLESLFDELDKPANNILKHNLESYLNTSIKASNSDIKDSENIQKLNIILLNSSQGDIGWDIFCLEYNVKLPLNVIFNNKLMKEYQKLFLFFWKIKRIKYGQINYIWKKIKNLNYNSIRIKNKSFIKKLINTSIIFNQEIVHFITNLHNYFSLEVLETQYKKIKSDLSKIKNLDELIKIHKLFVENIKKQCLLDDDNRTLIIKISEIFDIILKFKKVFDVLYSFAFEINYGNNYNFNRIKNIEDYLKQIYVLYDEYKMKIIEFIEIIKVIGKNNIKYLAMKLDYNYYYSNLEKEQKDEKDLEVVKNINQENIRRKILEDENSFSKYNQSENSKNDYEENNNIIDENKIVNKNLENEQNNINNDDEMEENEKSENKEEEEIKREDYNNKENKINFNENNDELNENNININNFNINNNNINELKNNFIYNKQKIKDDYNSFNNNLNNDRKINNISKNKENIQNINTKEDELDHEEKTYQYEDNNQNENEINDEDVIIENDSDDIDEEDKIVTNIIPKIYGISTKAKSNSNSKFNK